MKRFDSALRYAAVCCLVLAAFIFLIPRADSALADQAQTECTASAGGHVAEVIPAVAATCTQPGSGEGSRCSACGEILQTPETIPATGHTEETIPGTDSTCTAAGKTDGVKCSVCDAILTAQTDKPLAAHTPELIIESDAAHAYYCDDCGTLLSREQHSGEADWDYYEHYRTCTVCGWAYGKGAHTASSCSSSSGCSGCGATDVYLERPDHQLSIVPTGYNYHLYQCTVCSYTDSQGWCTVFCTKPGVCSQCLGASTLSPSHFMYGQHDGTHHWEACRFCDVTSTRVAHTVYCSDPGKCTVCSATDCTSEPRHKQYATQSSASQHWEACASCGAVKEGTLADHYVSCQNPGVCTKCGASGCTNAIRHSMSIYLMDSMKHWRNCTHPSCDYIEFENHVVYCRTTTCTICNTTNCKNAPIHRQEEDVSGTDATCTASGLTDGKYCHYCKKMSLEQTVVPAKGHTEEVIPGKAATCTASGLTDGKQCTVCGAVTVKQTAIPAKGHTEEVIPGKAATCTVGGLTDGRQCTVCGAVTAEQTATPARGHTETIIPARAATCAAPGLTEGSVCSVCGAVLTAQETIPGLGHSFGGFWIPGTQERHHLLCRHGCGQYITADCDYLTAAFGESELRICPVCGRLGEETAGLITSAYLSIPVANRPGTYVARSHPSPFDNEPDCLAVLTAVYEQSGSILQQEAFETPVTIKIPLPLEGSFRVAFVSTDPVTNQTVLLPVEHTVSDGKLFFTTEQLGLFLLIAE